MHDQTGQQLIAEVAAPLDAPDAINALAEARDLVGEVRDGLADYGTQGIPGIVTELDRAMGILVACEALILAIAKRDGMDLRGTVGDVVRDAMADDALRLGATHD